MIERLMVGAYGLATSALVAVAGITAVHRLTDAAHHWARLTLSVAAWGQ